MGQYFRYITKVHGLFINFSKFAFGSNSLIMYIKSIGDHHIIANLKLKKNKIKN
jgi:hypothetical protein